MNFRRFAKSLPLQVLQTFCSCGLICCSFNIQSISVLILLASQSFGWCVPLDTSHSVGISPLFSTMQSGPQGSDMSNIPLSFSTWEHKNEQESPPKTPPPRCLPPSTHPSIPALIPLWLIYSWAPRNKALYERKHPLWGRDTFWIRDTKHFIFLLVSLPPPLPRQLL